MSEWWQRREYGKICHAEMGVSNEDVDDRIRWHSLIELGALQDHHPSLTTAAK